MPAANAYEFGPYRLDATGRRLWRHGHPVALSAQACDLLLALLESSPEVVTHDAIQQRVWRDTSVSPESLRIAIHRLRRTLDDEGESPRYVEAVAKQGYRFRPPVSMVKSPAAVTRTLAILPIECDNNNEIDACSGIADALMTRLHCLRHLVIRPMPATASIAKGRRDLRAIGQKLKVDLILDGRLDVDGETIRLSLQLLSVADDRVMWAQRFEGPLTDPFSFEATIATAVATALALPLTPAETRMLTTRETTDAEARRLYVRGVRQSELRTPESMRCAADAFGAAVEREPGYARAWAARANVTLLSAYFLDRPTGECMPQARAFAERALELDPDLSSASATLAHVLMRYDWEFERAEALYRRGIAINATNASAHQLYSLDLAALGRFDEALAENEIAQELDPLSPSYRAWRMWLWVLSNRPDEALRYFEAFKEPLARHPSAQVYLGWAYVLEEQCADAEAAFCAVQKMGGGPIALGSLGYVFGMTGRRDEAIAVRDQLRARASYLQPDVDLPVHAGLQDDEATLACLERCCDERTYNVITAGVNPALTRVRHMPRYQAVLRRLGLPVS